MAQLMSREGKRQGKKGHHLHRDVITRSTAFPVFELLEEKHNYLIKIFTVYLGVM